MSDQHIREQLIKALTAAQAHQTFDDVIANFPAAHYNSRPPNTPYSFWHLLEHLRIAQADILDYIENSDYRYLKFPDDYWPAPELEADESAWQRTIAGFQSDLASLSAIVNDPARDLYRRIPHGEPGHTILREVLVVAAHNSYHIGEFGILRGTLGLW